MTVTRRLRSAFRPTADILTACLVLTTLAACGRAPANAGRSAGAPVVVQPSDVHVLGTSEAIAIVEDLDVLPDGTVWVLNSSEPLFVGFGPDGSPLRVHGRRGGGPDEFRGPAGFVVGGIDGQAWVFDVARHMMIEVSRPDGRGREIALPRAAVPPMSLMPGIKPLSSHVVRTARLGNELILPRRSSPPDAGVYSIWLSAWTADLVALDPRTDSVRTVVALGRVLGDPTSYFDMTGTGLPFPLWYRLWAVCANREIRVYDRLRNEVRGFTRDGTEVKPIALPPPRVTSVTRDQYAGALFGFATVEAEGGVPPSGGPKRSRADSARIMKGFSARVTASPDQLVKVLPRYTDLRCDERGMLWMQPFDIDRGGVDGGPVWLRIAPDGTTDEFRLPDRFDPYRFTSRRIWGVQRSALDVASVAWIEVPRER